MNLSQIVEVKTGEDDTPALFTPNPISFTIEPD